MTLDELAARVAQPLEAVAAELYRDHDMPPNKDSHGYDYRMGWWDGVHHAASVARKASKTTRVLPPGVGA